MKKCPQCNAIYNTDDEYCQNDGTTLVADIVQNSFYSNETPTVFTPNFQTPAAAAKVENNSNMKWAFPVIGLLLGVIVVLGFLAFSSQDKKENKDAEMVTSENNEVKNKQKENIISEQPQEQIQKPVETVQQLTSIQNNQIPGIFPEGSTRYLNQNDIYGKSSWNLRIMRNEIFARHGYIFKDADLRNYFMSQNWYQPRFTDVSGYLSEIEKRNAKLLKSNE